MDTTKNALKPQLDAIATKTKSDWYGQAVHKIAVGQFWLDMLEIKDQKQRDAAMKIWLATPSSFGTNCSALAQALGRPSQKAKLEETFAGF